MGSLFQCINPAPWTKAYRTSFLSESGIRFQELQYANDLFFTYATLSRARTLFAIPEPLVWYREHKGSLQHSKRLEPLAFSKALQSLKEYLIDNNTYDKLAFSYSRLAIERYAYNLIRSIINDDEASLIAIWKDCTTVIKPLLELEESIHRYGITELPAGEQNDRAILERVLSCTSVEVADIKKAIIG